MMLVLLSLALDAGPLSLTLAAGQGNLYTAHWRDFPKVGWVVGAPLPVNSSPQLAGPMAGVLEAGARLEVGGVGTPVPRAAEPGVLDEVLVLSLGPGPLHRAGYALARGVPVFETMVARCAADAVVFATVVGSRLVDGVEGMVLDLELWVRHGNDPPTLLLAGANRPPLATLGVPGGVAIALGGAAVVLDAGGAVVWRSPDGEAWVLDGVSGRQVRLRGAAGQSLLVDVPVR